MIIPNFIYGLIFKPTIKPQKKNTKIKIKLVTREREQT